MVLLILQSFSSVCSEHYDFLAVLFVEDAGGPQWFGISIHCQYEYFWLCLLVEKSRHLCVRGDNKKGDIRYLSLYKSLLLCYSIL